MEQGYTNRRRYFVQFIIDPAFVVWKNREKGFDELLVTVDWLEDIAQLLAL